VASVVLRWLASTVEDIRFTATAVELSIGADRAGEGAREEEGRRSHIIRLSVSWPWWLLGSPLSPDGLELRRLFPGIADNHQAAAGARTIAPLLQFGHAFQGCVPPRFEFACHWRLAGSTNS
jgi:hypothetical protein